MALGAGFVAYKLPLRFLHTQKYIVGMAIFFFVLQLLVFVPGVGTSLNGARGWINIASITTIQPAEFFKLAYVVFLSARLIKKRQFI